MAAVANDPDVAEAVAHGIIELPEDREAPSLAEWDLQTSLLAGISDRLDSVILAVMASAGAKSLPKMTAQPRPRTAVGEAVRVAKERGRMAGIRSLVEILTPDHKPSWLYRDHHT